METLLAPILIAIPATIGSLAAWRAATITKTQTNGALTEPLKRIEDRLVRVEERVVRVEERLS